MKISSHCIIGQGDALYFLNSGTHWAGTDSLLAISWKAQETNPLARLEKMTDPQLTVQVKRISRDPARRCKSGS